MDKPWVEMTDAEKRERNLAAFRIDYDNRGNLDDVAIGDVETFRLEYMENNIVWIQLYRRDKPDVVFWLNARGKITGRHEIDP